MSAQVGKRGAATTGSAAAEDLSFYTAGRFLAGAQPLAKRSWLRV